MPCPCVISKLRRTSTRRAAPTESPPFAHDIACVGEQAPAECAAWVGAGKILRVESRASSSATATRRPGQQQCARAVGASPSEQASSATPASKCVRLARKRRPWIACRGDEPRAPAFDQGAIASSSALSPELVPIITS
jgi:hypothetical protein